MPDNIVTYNDITGSISGRKIQKGLNYRINGKYSIFLMSSSPTAPYSDTFDGGILVYEGQDISRKNKIDPKKFDQCEKNKNGTLSANGKFFQAAKNYKNRLNEESETIKVYEKVKKNDWIDRGFFRLVDAKKVKQEGRMVFKFFLLPEDTNNIPKKEIEKAIQNKDEYIVKEILVSESRRNINARNGQNIIRKYCLADYDNRCALCDINDPDLLVASHIIPWSKDETKRGLLNNLICLCVIHDKLFEQGKLIVAKDDSISFSELYLKQCNESKTCSLIKEITNAQLRLPKINPPNKELLSIKIRSLYN